MGSLEQGRAVSGGTGHGIVVQEVGPRDGLQNQATMLTVEQKVELVERLVAAGLKRVEVGSFVHPKAVPQMADTDAVFAALNREARVVYSGLVLNERGFERAVAAGVQEIHFAFGVSETFNRQNQRATPEESFDAFARLVPMARDQGMRCTMTLATAFGCPFEGPVDPGRVVEWASRAVATGMDEVVLADTIGVAVPTQVRELVARIRREVAPAVPVGCHFHNTRNTGMANVYAALEAGATVFDASVGGLGGCPFAPGAAGNIATEDLVYMLSTMGIDTGVDLEAIISVARWLEEQLGYTLPGMVMKAGPFVPVAPGG